MCYLIKSLYGKLFDLLKVNCTKSKNDKEGLEKLKTEIANLRVDLKK